MRLRRKEICLRSRPGLSWLSNQACERLPRPKLPTQRAHITRGVLPADKPSSLPEDSPHHAERNWSDPRGDPEHAPSTKPPFASSRHGKGEKFNKPWEFPREPQVIDGSWVGTRDDRVFRDGDVLIRPRLRAVAKSIALGEQACGELEVISLKEVTRIEAADFDQGRPADGEVAPVHVGRGITPVGRRHASMESFEG